MTSNQVPRPHISNANKITKRLLTLSYNQIFPKLRTMDPKDLLNLIAKYNKQYPTQPSFIIRGLFSLRTIIINTQDPDNGIMDHRLKLIEISERTKDPSYIDNFEDALQNLEDYIK